MLKFPVQEIFGPTIQGEGPQAGGKTIFVRFAGCDYDCLWCDTKETWKITDQDRLTALEIVTQILELSNDTCNHVTLTGGNPLLYELGPLVKVLQALKYTVAVETQGSIYKPWINDVNNIVISPKPPSSGAKLRADGILPVNTFLKRMEGESFSWMKPDRDITIKVPIFNSIDFDWFLRLKDEIRGDNKYQDYKWYLSVGNDSPTQEGSIQKRLLNNYEWLVGKVIKSKLKDVYVLPQLHTLIWGNRKGV
jgi:7-carboxy-7-deazaguanine synthase